MNIINIQNTLYYKPFCVLAGRQSTLPAAVSPPARSWGQRSRSLATQQRSCALLLVATVNTR